MKIRRDKGFTLIELLIVVAIIGIIAAIAIPNLLSAIQRGKQKRAMGEVRSIATAAQSYSTDQEIFPIQAWGDPSVNGDFTPDYIKSLPNLDAWGRTNYSYGDNGGTGTEFGAASYGKDVTADEAPDAPTLCALTTVVTTTCFEDDIGWANDGFIVRPEGKQRKCL